MLCGACLDGGLAALAPGVGSSVRTSGNDPLSLTRPIAFL
jgi:hypothetical protein